jgi:hypothetical protein
MERRRVAGTERRGDAALSVRCRTVEERSLGEQQHVAMFGRTPGCVEARNATAHDEKPGSEPIDHP